MNRSSIATVARQSLSAGLAAAILCAFAPWACSAGGGQSTTGSGGAGGSAAVSSSSSGGASAATSSSSSGDIGFDGGLGDAGDAGGCVGDDPPALDSGVAAPVLAAAFEPFYTVFDLGPIPGMPSGHLGGCVIKQGDPGTLLVAGDSEAQTGAIYEIKVKRNQCGHIIGFVGTASLVAQTPYVDANLLYGANGVLLYTQWPVNQISQLPMGATAPAATTDMNGLGVVSSVSGLGFVPPGLPAAGGLRTVTWSSGNWYHLGLGAGAMGLYVISNPVEAASPLPGGPGGFAYVPKGSPGFPKQSLIISEWSADTVAVYEVDDQGDPIVASRQDFFTSFPKPWGAYFEPETGDYLFLTWGPTPDRVYVVQGFLPPPPPPPPPN
ncbi:MAG: hypothetical protein QM820_31200 [Minicystis sp.]